MEYVLVKHQILREKFSFTMNVLRLLYWQNITASLKHRILLITGSIPKKITYLSRVGSASALFFYLISCMIEIIPAKLACDLEVDFEIFP